MIHHYSIPKILFTLQPASRPMKKYHIHVGAEQLGPFSIEELKDRNISADTPVWYNESPNWIKAGEVAELKPIFAATAVAASRKPQAAVKQKSTAPYIVTIVCLLACI